MVRPGNIDIAAICDLGLKLAPASRHHSGRSASASRAAAAGAWSHDPSGHRSGRERRAQQPDRRGLGALHQQLGEIWPTAHRFDGNTGGALRRFRHVGPPPDRLQRRDNGTPARAIPWASSTNAAIGIQDGRIVRIGKRTELAGFRATEVVPLDGAWVTPGTDRLPHPFGVRRQPRRRACDAPRRCVLRGDRQGRRRHRLDRRQDPRCVGDGADLERPGGGCTR